MTIDELSKLEFEQIEFEDDAQQRCKDCDCAIHETETGARETVDGVVCRDCFYARAGEIVEAHPIASSQM